jgi:hypothetical protein
VNLDEAGTIVGGTVLPWLIIAEGTGVSVPWGELWAALCGAGLGWSWKGSE